MQITDTKTIDRTAYIGGSDAGSIFGVNEYRSRRRVWRDKVYGEEPMDPLPNPIQRGNDLEPIIHALALKQDPTINSPEMFEKYHKGAEGDPQIWLYDARGEGQAPIGGHPDGISAEGVLWEYKCPGTYTLDAIHSDGVPDSWIFQVRHYLMLSGLPLGRIAVLDYNAYQLFTVDVEADPDFHAKMLAEYDDFWFFVEHEIEPPSLPSTVDLSSAPNMAALEAAAEQYLLATEERYGGERRQKEARGQIKSMIRTAPLVYTENYCISQTNVDKGTYSYNRLVVRKNK
jgi:hypothetical protein